MTSKEALIFKFSNQFTALTKNIPSQDFIFRSTEIAGREEVT